MENTVIYENGNCSVYQNVRQPSIFDAAHPPKTKVEHCDMVYIAGYGILQ
jgi:hypothetical protein